MTNNQPLTERERELYFLVAKLASDGKEACREIEAASSAFGRAAFLGEWRRRMTEAIVRADVLVQGGGA